MDALLFLSDAWLDAVDGCLRQASDDPEPATGGTSPVVVVRYVIEGGPPDTGGYDLVIEPPATTGVRRSTGPAQVTLTMDWALAVAINQGAESAQHAVLDGRIMIGGDPQVLVDHQDLVSRGNELVAGLRASTVYA